MLEATVDSSGVQALLSCNLELKLDDINHHHHQSQQHSNLDGIPTATTTSAVTYTARLSFLKRCKALHKHNSH